MDGRRRSLRNIAKVNHGALCRENARKQYLSRKSDIRRLRESNTSTIIISQSPSPKPLPTRKKRRKKKFKYTHKKRRRKEEESKKQEREEEENRKSNEYEEYITICQSRIKQIQRDNGGGTKIIDLVQKYNIIKHFFSFTDAKKEENGHLYTN